MKRRFPLFIWGALAWLTASLSPVRAGGPLFVTGTGEPFRWDASQPVRYQLDPGPLGRRSFSSAAALVQQVLQSWQEVDGSRLRTEVVGELSRDITGRNVLSFLDRLPPNDPNPVLFDQDGSIFEMLIGRGASQFLLGISIPEGDPGTGRIVQSTTLLNGSLYDRLSDAAVRGSMTHELGHSLGLAHSQLNAEELMDGDPDNDQVAPAMFYRGPNDPGGLHADDRAWFAWLYPSAEFHDRTGSIRGRLLLPDGVTGLQGIHVIARRVGDPQVTAVSSVSGFMFHGVGGGIIDPYGQPVVVIGGSGDPARLGEFLIPGLPPGSYTLEVRELEPLPSIPVPLAFLIGGPKFWRERSSSQDPPASSTPIVVNAGQEVTGIDLVLNGESLGEPRQVAESEPNELPSGQSVTLPAVIRGAVEDSSATAGPPLPAGQLESALHDVYRATLREPTIVTAILAAEQPGTDLDLYVLRQSGDRRVLAAKSTEPGTPPEVLQFRLAAGRYYFGVYRSGTRGSAYTLQLLTSPAPDPEARPPVAVIHYALLFDVTTTSAAVRWETSVAAPSVVHFNLPLQEVGSTTRKREHTLALSGLSPATRSEVTVSALAGTRLLDSDQVIAPLASAALPAADGEPRIIAAGTATSLFGIPDLVEVVVRISNPGDGDALRVRIDSLTLPSGWYNLPEVISGTVLPDSFEVGQIGAGGAGALVIRIIRLSGSAAARVTVHGTYTDRTGTVFKF